ncbi:MAG: iron-sulfur cluster insertion protein ErpA [Planctomycetes bacterium]|nr:iron-sulfur cluster insertion protein ErpA [Planctomycetota bacterium]
MAEVTAPTTTEASPIKLTSEAIQEIKVILKEQEMPASTVLRIGIVGGGCSGFQYHMGLEESASDDDETVEAEGVKIVVDPLSLQYLRGVTIDFQESIQGRGFVFDNPNAKSTCGCGSSFSV